jgi:hypothetical protein
LKKGASVFLSLFGDNPHNLNVIVLERDWLINLLHI